MRTDPALIARLALELRRRFKRARVRDAALLEDGRFAVALWHDGRTELLCADLFAATPVLTVEDGELPIVSERGFVRAAASALAGKSLLDIRAIEDERIIRCEFGAASRFGVEERYALVYELVPRFGNVLLLKDETIVAALKEFKPAQGAKRSIMRGARYEPPPARAGGKAFLSDVNGAQALDADLYLYRDEEGRLLQAYPVPLGQFAQARVERSSSMLDVLRELRSTGSQEKPAPDKRRTDLDRKLADREQKIRTELAHVNEQLAETAATDDLRTRGDAIYAGLHDLPAEQRAKAKSEAAALFARYKKSIAARSHLEKRRGTLTQSLSDVEALRWELERAEPDRVAEIAAYVSPRRTKTSVQTKKRKPQVFTAPGGSRIVLGRSPIENAEVTFRIARPNDFWFHARGQPGAHVVLQRDDKREPPPEDVEAAAQLAAFHSKGRQSGKVTVDYTRRKHVRKRPDAAPGLVFYVNAESITVEPRDLQ